MKENPTRSLPGIPVLLGLLAVDALCTWAFIDAAANPPPSIAVLVAAIVVALLATFCLLGLTVHAGARILHDCGIL